MTSLAWQGPPLSVIGVATVHAGFARDALQVLAGADIIIGAERHFSVLDHLEPGSASFLNPETRRLHYPRPFSSLWDVLLSHQDRRIVLLASGDPLLFGLGGFLRQRLLPEQLNFYPAISSIQMAFAKVGHAWQEAEIISLHGRPLLSLRARLKRNRLYALLTDSRSHPTAIAAELVNAGFAESDFWVCEELGNEAEHISHFSAATLATSSQSFSPLNVVVTRTCGNGGILPEFPGVSDELFSTDGDQPGRGLLTKREVRLTALSLLQPHAGQIGWDIGAGCGGVAVEWARWEHRSAIHALEFHPERLKHLNINRERFGVVMNLQVHEGRAPAALDSLPTPDTVFVGGGGADLPAILDACWARLSHGGALVAAAVTEDARVALHLFAGNDAEWIELSVARGDSLAQQRLMRPHLPVLLMKRVKP